MKERKTMEVVEYLEINDGKVSLGGLDITDSPIYNYVCLTHDGPVLSLPTPFECRSEGTCIIAERDGDRVFYRVFWREKEVAYCKSRKEAEQVLENCDQMQREADNCKEY